MNRRALLLAGAAIPLQARAGVRWRQAAPMPLNVQEIYTAVHHGRLYVAGGIAAKAGVPYFTSAVVSYDPAADSWRDEAELPLSIHHGALVSTGEALFLLGGFHGGYTHIWRMVDSVYQLTEQGWQQIGSLPKPLAEGVTTLSPAGTVHLVTGQTRRAEANSARSDHREVEDHWRWDDGRWHTAAPIPTPRNSATGGWLDGHLVIAGGRTAKGNLNTTEIYDPSTDRWHTARPMPQPQAGTASVVHDNQLIVFGGEIFSPRARVFPDVWRYSLTQDEWQPLPDMVTPRHGLGAGLFGDAAYVVGGATRPSGRGTSDANEVLELS